MEKNINFKDLRVWQDSMGIVKDVYSVSSTFPREERYGLVDQIRRAAVSIPSNIAEGHARASNKEFIRFLHISNGSAAEVITQLHIAKILGYTTVSIVEELENRIIIIQRMISKLIASKEKSSNPLINQSPINQSTNP